MTAFHETRPEPLPSNQEQLEKATVKTLITKHPSLREAEIALKIYESFRLDQIAASPETKTDQ